MQVKILVLALTGVILSGCVHQLAQMSSKMVNVQLGMNEKEIVQVMGGPTSVTATEESRKIFNYKLYTTASSAVSDGEPEDFFIVFNEGVVSSYGGVDVLNALQGI